jgi:hypothetical protein
VGGAGFDMIMLRVLVCLLPLLLTPLWAYLIADGYLNLGGGEKDLIWLLPWLLWSALFAIAGAISWSRGHSVVGMIKRGLGWATGGLFGIWVTALLFFSEWAGLSGG